MESTKKDQPCAGTTPSSSEPVGYPIPHRGALTGSMPRVGGTVIVTPIVGRPAASFHEKMGSQRVNPWMKLLEVSPAGTSSGPTPTQTFEVIPSMEMIEKRVEGVLVLSNKSFPRSVAVKQVASRLRHWALRHGKQKAAELAAQHFGGAGER